MMKNELKYAFTAVEMMVVFTIIGILSVVGLQTIINVNQDNFPKYLNVRTTLEKAVYATYTDTAGDEGASAANKKEWERDGRPFPTTAREMCCRLVEYINFTPIKTDQEFTDKCDYACSEVVESINDFSYGCNISETDTSTDADTGATTCETGQKPMKFTSTNGMVYYISPQRKLTKSLHNLKDDALFSYFLIFVDLNGYSVDSKGNQKFLPNTPLVTEKDYEDKIIRTKPDVVPFVVPCPNVGYIEGGQVAPVGVPVYDSSYATARARASIPVIASSGAGYAYSKSASIDEARQIAFGHKEENNNLLTIDFYKELKKIHPRLVPKFENDTPTLRCFGDFKVDLKEGQEVGAEDESSIYPECAGKNQAQCGQPGNSSCGFIIDNLKR